MSTNDSDGETLTIEVQPETYERLEFAAIQEESPDDVIRRHLSAVPGVNEWVCRHCGDDICPPHRHHEWNDLVIWQVQVEDSDHYRPDPFCSQSCFRDEIEELLPNTEADR